MTAVGCGNLDDQTSVDESATTAAPVASNDILGFEKSAGWSVSSASPRLSERRTQGIQSFALDAPAFETHLTSQKVSSTATGLAAIGSADSVFALDVMLPETIKNPTATAYVQLKLKSSSRSLSQTDLGQVSLKGAPGGVYTTVKFKIPSSVRSKLAGAAYSDLIFDLYVHPPDCPSDTVRIDNLRVKSPSAAPAGAGVSIDLVALHSYAPDVSTPGEAHFPVGVAQIPQSFHVKLGSSAGGTAKLELGYNTTIAWTCTYAAGNVGGVGKSYDFSKCTGGGKAGDLVSVDFARLTIVKGDATAGPTKIRAQVAGNPMGDVTGRALIPAIPTFWGDAPDEINQIIKAYSAALNPPNPPKKTEERFITLPTGEFALRHGDGSPRNNYDPSLPPPPNDPPFSQEGHMNPGSSTWDAWWALDGSLSYGDADDTHTSHLDTQLSGNALVWGFPVQVASLQMSIDTNNGKVTPGGFSNPSTHGELHMFLFGSEIPGGGSADQTTGFRYNIDQPFSKDAPTIHVWIFSITAGVDARATLTATGDLRLNGFFVNVTPTLSAGAHLEGDIDLGIASGGVKVSIDFLKVTVPINANVKWAVDTTPAICAATLDFDLNASMQLTSLGGKVDLVAKFGVCPFCDHESWNLFNWTGVTLASQQIFDFPVQAAKFPLADVATCRRDLNVSIISPIDDQVALSTQKLVLAGTALRPAGPSQGGTTTPQPGGTPLDLNIDNPIECQYWSWRSSEPTDTFEPATGCSPVVTFGNAGSHVITLNVVDQYGEKGLASVSVNVNLPPPGPIPYILTPTPTLPQEAIGTAINTPIALSGGATHTTGAVTFAWSYLDNMSNEHPIGPGATQTLSSPGANFLLKLTATDSAGTSSVYLQQAAHGAVR